MNLFKIKKNLKPGLIIIFFLIISIGQVRGKVELSEKRSLSLEDYYRMESVGARLFHPTEVGLRLKGVLYWKTKIVGTAKSGWQPRTAPANPFA